MSVTEGFLEMRVALVHDYLNQMGGAEQVLLALHDLFPQAPIYTSIYAPERVDRVSARRYSHQLHAAAALVSSGATSPSCRSFRTPSSSIDLRAYDLVISDSSAFAKGVVTRPETLHICYCHTPMRWAWNYEDYVERERLGQAGARGAAALHHAAAPVGLCDGGAGRLFRGESRRR